MTRQQETQRERWLRWYWEQWRQAIDEKRFDAALRIAEIIEKATGAKKN